MALAESYQNATRALATGLLRRLQRDNTGSDDDERQLTLPSTVVVTNISASAFQLALSVANLPKNNLLYSAFSLAAHVPQLIGPMAAFRLGSASEEMHRFSADEKIGVALWYNPVPWISNKQGDCTTPGFGAVSAEDAAQAELLLGSKQVPNGATMKASFVSRVYGMALLDVRGAPRQMVGMRANATVISLPVIGLTPYEAAIALAQGRLQCRWWDAIGARWNKAGCFPGKLIAAAEPLSGSDVGAGTLDCHCDRLGEFVLLEMRPLGAVRGIDHGPTVPMQSNSTIVTTTVTIALGGETVVSFGSAKRAAFGRAVARTLGVVPAAVEIVVRAAGGERRLSSLEADAAVAAGIEILVTIRSDNQARASAVGMKLKKRTFGAQLATAAVEEGVLLPASAATLSVDHGSITAVLESTGTVLSTGAPSPAPTPLGTHKLDLTPAVDANNDPPSFLWPAIIATFLISVVGLYARWRCV